MRFGSSLAVRITAALVVATFVTAASLLGGIYLVSVKQPMDAVRAELQAEADTLSGLYHRSGEEALKSALRDRRAAPSADKAFDAFLEANGQLITGNLPSWPVKRQGNWTTIEADLYRDGGFVPASDGGRFDVLDPATEFMGSPWVEVHYARHRGPIDSTTRYLILPATRQAPPDFTLLVADSNAALFVRDTSQWKAMRYAPYNVRTRSALYHIPRESMLRDWGEPACAFDFDLKVLLGRAAAHECPPGSTAHPSTP